MSGPCRHREPEVIEALTSSGYDVRLDPAPLDPLGELIALTRGRRTYTRYLNGDTHPRTPGKIRARPAGTVPRQDVHAEHRCGPDMGR